jgi:ParB/RepB/Spo0J family partition protein
MPILGKDFQLPKEESVKTREIKVVNAMLVKPSTILPKREYSREVIDSVKRDGIQQPIIVRPHPEKEGEYEIIDGHNRWYGVTEIPNINNYVPGREPKILVDIRYGLNDSDVFKLSHIMHKRKERNTYEQAELYVKWIEAKAKELGKEEGALTEVAKELIDDIDSDHPMYPVVLNSKQSLLSQYVKVYKLFKTLEDLEQKHPDKFREIDLNVIKRIGVTRLYALTKLMDNPSKLIKVVQKLSNNPNMTLERLKELTEEQFVDRSQIPWSAIIRLPPDISEDFKRALYKSNPKVFESSLTNNEILRDATKCLIKLFVDQVEDFEVEVERTRDGNKITAIWMKTTRTYEPAQEIKLIPKT